MQKIIFLLESPTKNFDEICKDTSVPFFIPDLDLLNCEVDNFTFKGLY